MGFVIEIFRTFSELIDTIDFKRTYFLMKKEIICQCLRFTFKKRKFPGSIVSSHFLGNYFVHDNILIGVKTDVAHSLNDMG